jgi:hypothetical protein
MTATEQQGLADRKLRGHVDISLLFRREATRMGWIRGWDSCVVWYRILRRTGSITNQRLQQSCLLCLRSTQQLSEVRLSISSITTTTNTFPDKF